MKYNKLVRDKIPEIIKRKGGVPITHIADNVEYGKKLREKLEEGVREFLDNEIIEEIADILEVVDAICEHKGFSKAEVAAVQKSKAGERGGFKNKIILEES